MRTRLKNLKGKKFCNWLVLSRLTDEQVPCGQKKTHWLCLCDCGKLKTVYQHSLTSGKSRSCGCRTYHALPKGLSAARNMLANYKCKAKRQKLEFALTEQQFLTLTKQPCFYCGKEPSNISHKGSKRGSYIYSGLDRVNNNKGYTLINTVPSCKDCNLAKRMLTLEQFFNLVKRIYEKHNL